MFLQTGHRKVELRRLVRSGDNSQLPYHSLIETQILTDSGLDFSVMELMQEYTGRRTADAKNSKPKRLWTSLLETALSAGKYVSRNCELLRAKNSTRFWWLPPAAQDCYGTSHTHHRKGIRLVFSNSSVSLSAFFRPINKFLPLLSSTEFQINFGTKQKASINHVTFRIHSSPNISFETSH